MHTELLSPNNTLVGYDPTYQEDWKNIKYYKIYQPKIPETESCSKSTLNLAKFLSAKLNDDQVLIALIYGTVSGINHAICLAGFQIDERRYMDVLILDSAAGVYWMPIEHLDKILTVAPFIGVRRR